MKDINFLVAGAADGKQFNIDGKKTSIPILVALLLVLLAVGGKLTLMQANQAITQKIAEKEAYIADNAIIYEIENNIKDYNAQTNKTRVLLETLQKINVKNSEVFECLAQGMPDELFLASYIFAEDKKVQIKGESPTKEAVARYTWSLKQLKLFKDVLLNTVKREEKSNQTGEKFIYDFTVEL